MTKIPLNKIIRISERVIKPHNEAKVKAIMSGLDSKVREWPGFLSIETLVDAEDSNKHIVITEWEDRGSMKTWHKSDLCKNVVSQLDEVLEGGVKYQELMHHEDNVFLL